MFSFINFATVIVFLVTMFDDSTQLVTVPRSSPDPIAELCRALVVLKRERYHIREVFKLSSDGHTEKVYWYGRSQYIQLDDTLTEKEINALLKHLNPKGAVAEHLNFAKKANEMGQDALWKLREEVKDTCKAINDLLHEPATRDAILKAQTEHQRDAMPMMDCGWLNWFPLEGTEFAEKFNTVRSTGNGPYFLDIDMPIIDQSVNVQSYGGDVVRDLVSNRLGIDIYYVRHLD